MPDLVADDGVEFPLVEPFHQAPGHPHAGVAGCAAEGEGVGVPVVDDAEPDEGDAGLPAAAGDDLPDGMVGVVALAVVGNRYSRYEPLDEPRVDGVLQQHHEHGERHREPDGSAEEPDGGKTDRDQQADQSEHRRKRPPDHETHRNLLWRPAGRAALRWCDNERGDAMAADGGFVGSGLLT